MQIDLIFRFLTSIAFLFVPGYCQISGTSSGSQTPALSNDTDAYLIFANYDLTSGQNSLVSAQINAEVPPTTTNILVKGNAESQFWAMAMDYRRGLVYYTDYQANYFGVYHVETQLHDTVLEGLSFGIDGLDVDWFTGNIYMTDTKLNRILVTDPTVTHLVQIQTINSLVPAKIAVDPLTRTLYWSERQNSQCSIYKSDLAGNNRQLLHQFDDTSSIDAMAIDFNANRLYWSDQVPSSIFSIGRLLSFDLDSPDNVTVHTAEFFARINGIAPFKDLIYYSDVILRRISAYNTTSDTSTVAISFDNAAFGAMVAYHPSSQPWSDVDQQAHPCTNNNCDHLCISDGDASFVCACSLGFNLQQNGRSCGFQLIGDNFGLIWDEKLKAVFQVPLDNPEMFSALPIEDIGVVQAVEYDYQDKMVYWSDTDKRIILRASLNGQGKEVFMNSTTTRSIGIDHISRNLYFADALSDAILVSSLDTPNVFSTLHVENVFTVWKLIVSHTLGKIFWTDWGHPNSILDAVGRVESSNLDGSGLLTVANDSLFPYGLTVDEQSNTVFWTEELFSGIRWFDLNSGTSGKLSLQFPVIPISIVAELTSYKDHLYITYRDSPYVHRVLISEVVETTTVANESTVQPYGPQIFYGLSGIRFIDSSTVVHTGTSTCSSAGEKCPQICLPSETQPMCVCGYHYVYSTANNTCTQVINFEDDVPPDFGDTCPDSVVESVDACSDEGFVNFTIPVATDESGPVTMKTTHTDEPPLRFTGTRGFNYKAVDASGNVAVCSFLITIRAEPHCLTLPSIPDNATILTTTCGSQFGSRIEISCDGRNGISFEYECTSNGVWRSIGNTDCYPETTTQPEMETTVPEQSAEEGSAGLSGGVIAGIVIAIVVVIVIVIGILLIIRYQKKSWVPSNVLWNRRNDDVGLDAKDRPTKSSNPYDII